MEHFYSRYGKVHYLDVFIDAPPRQCCYSASELQRELRRACHGQKLNHVYVNLCGYLDTLSERENYIDMSYMGGPTLLLFDKVAVELEIHGEGVVDFRIVPIWSIKRTLHVDYAPNDMCGNDRYYYDIRQHFPNMEFGICIEDVLVSSKGTYAFCPRNFQEGLLLSAARRSDLPHNVRFLLQNGTKLQLLSCDIEYYFVCFNSVPY